MADVKWIKIATDIFDDEKILLIESLPSSDSLIVIWFKLLCLAGKNNNDGVFLLNDRIAYTDEMLATIFRKDINTVRLALKTFEDFGMIQTVDGVVTIPNWNKHQDLQKIKARNEYMKKYMAEKRAAQKALISCKDTDVNTDVNTDVSNDVNANVNVNNSINTDANVSANVNINNHINNDINVNNQLDSELDNVLADCKQSCKHDVSGAELDNKDNKDNKDIYMGKKIKKANAFRPPSVDEVRNYCLERNNNVDPDKFVDFYASKGWYVGKNKMQDWRAAVRTWEQNDKPRIRVRDFVPGINSNHFNDIEQHEYDFDEFEAKMLDN